jgi:hypothetical protein
MNGNGVLWMKSLCRQQTTVPGRPHVESFSKTRARRGAAQEQRSEHETRPHWSGRATSHRHEPLVQRIGDARQ